MHSSIVVVGGGGGASSAAAATNNGSGGANNDDDEDDDDDADADEPRIQHHSTHQQHLPLPQPQYAGVGVGVGELQRPSIVSTLADSEMSTTMLADGETPTMAAIRNRRLSMATTDWVSVCSHPK